MILNDLMCKSPSEAPAHHSRLLGSVINKQKAPSCRDFARKVMDVNKTDNIVQLIDLRFGFFKHNEMLRARRRNALK